MPSTKSIFAMIEELGIDYDRFKKVVAYKDNWGSMVHAFEYIAVLAVIEEAWDAHHREQYWKEPASQSQGD